MPEMKRPIGEKVLGYLLHECLFQIPTAADRRSNQTHPKCKNF